MSFPIGDFAAAILEDEVVLRHIDDGHVYHFPVSSDGALSLQGLRFDANPDAKRCPDAYLFEAHTAALAALGPTSS
jgi:hypothetical protein